MPTGPERLWRRSKAEDVPLGAEVSGVGANWIKPLNWPESTQVLAIGKYSPSIIHHTTGTVAEGGSGLRAEGGNSFPKAPPMRNIFSRKVHYSYTLILSEIEKQAFDGEVNPFESMKSCWGQRIKYEILIKKHRIRVLKEEENHPTRYANFFVIFSVL